MIHGHEEVEVPRKGLFEALSIVQRSLGGAAQELREVFEKQGELREGRDDGG